MKKEIRAKLAYDFETERYGLFANMMLIQTYEEFLSIKQELIRRAEEHAHSGQKN